MARQTGLIKLKGSIGNVTFYTTVAGDLARQKGGIDAERIATDPAFQHTRENGSELAAPARLHGCCTRSFAA